MPTSYSGLVNFYRVSMDLTGFSSALEKYVQRLPLELPPQARILDAGCGTGILGIAIKKSFPESVILATDIEEKFFPNIKEHLGRLHFPENEFQLGISDINTPEKVALLHNEEALILTPESFDAVVVGGVLGYARNPQEALLRLLSLVKPGGYFVDIEMAENVVAKSIGRFYKYHNLNQTMLQETLGAHDFDSRNVPFTLEEFPASLTRKGILGQKRSR